MKFEEVVLRGTRAAQPAATTVPVGSLFGVTDEGHIIERSNGTTWDPYSPAGLGDVVGPASSVDDRIATFDGLTGKSIQDGGATIAQVIAMAGGGGDVVGPASSVDDHIATFDGVTGKLLQDGGTTLATVQSDAVAAAVAAIVPIDILTETTGFPGGSTMFLRADQTFAALPAAATLTGTIGVTIDGGGTAITTGVKGYVQVPWAGTITGWTLLADVSGSAVVDVWKDTFANAPPVVGDSITASAKPTLSAAVTATSTTLTGWTTAIAAGDVVAFNVDSAATITRLTCQLTVART